MVPLKYNCQTMISYSFGRVVVQHFIHIDTTNKLILLPSQITNILSGPWTVCRIDGHSSDANTKVYGDGCATFKIYFLRLKWASSYIGATMNK